MATLITLFTNAISLLKNLWTIGLGLPQTLALIAPVIKILGSKEFLNILKAFKDSATKVWNQIKNEEPEIPVTEKKRSLFRERLRKRLEQRHALEVLQIDEAEYAAFCRLKNRDVEQNV